MANQSFSQRHGFAPPPKSLAENEMPGWVREGFANSLREFIDRTRAGVAPDVFNRDLYNSLKPLIWKVLKVQPPGSPVGGPWEVYIPKLIRQCEWWQFYDICEEVYRLIADTYGQSEAESFAQEVNDLFTREGVAWRFTGGRIERAYPPHITKKFEEVRALLRDPQFQGADEQFEKALQHLNRRPDPDTENCVKDAVGAMEATARIISGDHTETLSRILHKEPFRSEIHPALAAAIKKVYAYRGDVGGVAHGQVGPSNVGIEEAELILTVAAATILYLASKFGKYVE
jgi:hypothetical protein